MALLWAWSRRGARAPARTARAAASRARALPPARRNPRRGEAPLLRAIARGAACTKRPSAGAHIAIGANTPHAVEWTLHPVEADRTAIAVVVPTEIPRKTSKGRQGIIGPTRDGQR